MNSEVKKNSKITRALSNGWDFNKALVEGWKYYWRGVWGSYDDCIYKEHKTFAQCLQMCQQQRTAHGEQWNGMLWDTTDDGWCDCIKNDKGHDASKPSYLEWMHFKTN